MARLVAQGLRPGDIAERFGMLPSTVSIIINSPLFRAEVSRLEEQLELSALDAARELQELVPRAVEIIAQDLYASAGAGISRKEQRSTAFEILDRTGYAKKQDLHVGDKVVNIIYNIPEPGSRPEEFISKQTEKILEGEFDEDQPET